MTMLDRMLRHRGWLKWSLAIVILALGACAKAAEGIAPSAAAAKIAEKTNFIIVYSICPCRRLVRPPGVNAT